MTLKLFATAKPAILAVDVLPPWEFRAESIRLGRRVPGSCPRVVTPEGLIIARVARLGQSEGRDELAEDNARLIARAVNAHGSLCGLARGFLQRLGIEGAADLGLGDLATLARIGLALAAGKREGAILT